MKYIIMAGGHYREWKTPKHLLMVNGEEIVARTIRLLRENGITDIAISSDNYEFKKFCLPVLFHENSYNAMAYNNYEGTWLDAFYPMDEPACYIFGDVVFSPAAIRKIIETETDDIEFFGSAPPFAPEYPKAWVEPFALKVRNQKHLKRAVQKAKQLEAEGKFWRRPLMWELWTVIKGLPLTKGMDDYQYDSYTAINDYTCDIDHRCDIRTMNRLIKEANDE